MIVEWGILMTIQHPRKFAIIAMKLV